jgi:hypothetical protein
MFIFTPISLCFFPLLLVDEVPPCLGAVGGAVGAGEVIAKPLGLDCVTDGVYSGPGDVGVSGLENHAATVKKLGKQAERHRHLLG